MKDIVVVGGMSGIGRGLVEALPERCVVWSRRTGVDATDREAVEAAAREHVDRYGAPWALVHAAGPFRTGSVLGTGPEAFAELIDGNLRSAFTVARAVLPAMADAGRGRAIFFAAARLGRASAEPPAAIYYAAKAALVEMARALAFELAPSGVTVNVVAPGVVRHDASHGASQERVERDVPVGRAGDVTDVVHTLRWLLSERADYVTGTVISVDGGLALRARGAAGGAPRAPSRRR